MSTTDTSLEAHTELRAPVAQLSPSRVVQLGPQAAHSPTRLGGKTPPSATAMELDGSSEEAQARPIDHDVEAVASNQAQAVSDSVELTTVSVDDAIQPKRLKGQKDRWTNEEDTALLDLVDQHPEMSWDECSSALKTGRNGGACRKRWLRLRNGQAVAEKRAELGLENRKNARYTKEDDDQLRAAGDAAGGAVDWNAVGLRLSFPRTGKACYTRYHSIKSASPNTSAPQSTPPAPAQTPVWTHENLFHILSVTSFFSDNDWESVVKQVGESLSIEQVKHAYELLKETFYHPMAYLPAQNGFIGPLNSPDLEPWSQEENDKLLSFVEDDSQATEDTPWVFVQRMLRTSRSIKCIKAHAQKLKGAREDDEQVAGSTASIEAPLGDDDGETTEKQTLDTTIAQTFEESFQANSLAVNIESSSPQASSASASSPQLSEANVISSSSSTCLDVFSGLLPRWMWPTPSFTPQDRQESLARAWPFSFPLVQPNTTARASATDSKKRQRVDEVAGGVEKSIKRAKVD